MMKFFILLFVVIPQMVFSAEMFEDHGATCWYWSKPANRCTYTVEGQNSIIKLCSDLTEEDAKANQMCEKAQAFVGNPLIEKCKQRYQNCNVLSTKSEIVVGRPTHDDWLETGCLVQISVEGN